MYTNDNEPPVKPTCFGTQPIPSSSLYAERRCGFCDVNTACNDVTLARADAMVFNTDPESGQPPAIQCPSCGEGLGTLACVFAHEDPAVKERRSETLRQAVKTDTGKPMPELLPFLALEEVSNVLAFGARKYAPHNWRKGLLWSRLLGAALRHLYAWGRGEDKDPETGYSHLAHAGCCVLFLLEYDLSKAYRDLDDRRNGRTPT